MSVVPDPGFHETSVIVDREKYHELLNRSAKLHALEAAGVDNWEGYDEAMSSYWIDDGDNE